MTMLTKNHAILVQEVRAHLDADALVRGTYWKGGADPSDGKGCFIGCLTHSDDPKPAVERFGVPEVIWLIAENIFEALSDDEGSAFFAAFPDAVGDDGKDLSLVHWQFLAEELRALPPQTGDVKAAIDGVIVGMDLMASGGKWNPYAERSANDAARAAADACYATGSSRTVDGAADAASRAAAYATCAALRVEYAVSAVSAASRAAARAAVDSFASRAAARIRQRDTLLRLITNAPVMA